MGRAIIGVGLLLLACGGNSRSELGASGGQAGGGGADAGVGGSAAQAGSGAASGSAGAPAGAGGQAGNASAGAAGVGASVGVGGGGQSSGGTSSGGTSSGGTAGTMPFPGVTCSDPPPAGAPQPPAPKLYAGTCPTITPGRNTLQSSGKSREFLLVAPEDMQPDEQLPVAFLWHWLGGSANSFLSKAEVQAAVNEMRFLAVIPEKLDNDLNVFAWPYSAVILAGSVQQEAAFFDDLLSCVDAQYSVNRSCVASVGVSAGALWTVVLAGQRSEYLSSMMVLSGGTDVPQVLPYTKPARQLPAFVLWGGSSDNCATINFEQASLNLEQHLAQDGHFIVECTHNCGHGTPPFEPPAGLSKFSGLWRFFLDHPYWLPAGASPYTSDGLPVSAPEWCGVGPRSAVPRVGMCGPSEC